MNTCSIVNMNSLKFLLSILIVAIINEEIMGIGIFELRLKSLRNDLGKLHSGECCHTSTLNSKCHFECKTKFRICFKHYEAQIHISTPCTFGSTLTPVLGKNTIKNMEYLNVSDFDNPIRFPFNFTWPGAFSLIVEALNVENHSANTTKLINRSILQQWLNISESWTVDVHKTANSELQYEFRVMCDNYYYGPGCSKFCRPRDDEFGHYICSPDGEQVCLPGWEGEYCYKPICSPECNEQRGRCHKPNECLCHYGWKGPFCDQCEIYPGCAHGTCTKPWECSCLEGWGGLFCNQDLNYCTNHKPCKNGATCYNTLENVHSVIHASYKCNCTNGFTGRNCDTKEEEIYNPCFDNPCLNGICKYHGGDDFQCICKTGFIGSRCENTTLTCYDHPCQNGATCQFRRNGLYEYECECPAGYNGTNCEYQINDCYSNPCLNNGNCVDQVNGFQCICPIGFDGYICEINIDDCKNNPCKNGGQCIDGIHQFYCKCKDGYIGAFCENKVNSCDVKPCANNGKCTQLPNDYNCTCLAGFTGKDCSIEIHECFPDPCLNDGICLDRPNDYVCQCPDDYYGKNCEFSRIISSDVEAQIASLDSSKISTENVFLIIAVLFLIPILILSTMIAMFCLKQKQKHELAQADEEARLQNEQNALYNRRVISKTVTVDPLMIKNSWNKCTNVVSSSTSNSVPFSPKSMLECYQKDNYCLNKDTHHLRVLNVQNNKDRNSMNNKRFSTNYYNEDISALKNPTKNDLYISTPVLTNIITSSCNFRTDDMPTIINDDELLNENYKNFTSMSNTDLYMKT